MRDTAKQIINYWYSLQCLDPKKVPKYKANSNRNEDELIVHIKNNTNSNRSNTTTIYQQSVINPLWEKTNSRVSTYVVPLPNYSYNYSIIE